MQGRYDGWGLYDDAADPRLIVPKRDPILGWTINIGHRRGRIALVVIGVLAIAVLAGSIIVR